VAALTVFAILAIGLGPAPPLELRPSDAGPPSTGDGRPRNGVVAQGAREVVAPARHVDRAQLLSDATTLGAPRFEGRATGTNGAANARAWLLTRFGDSGLSPAGVDGFVQPFMVASRNLRAVLPGGRPFRTEVSAANLVGRVPGTDPDAHAIVITAHYDHLGIRDGIVYPGADDNASGVAVVLAAARHFSVSRPRHPMIFAALDAEEIGLRGARALVASPLLPQGRIALNVNLDMVSRSIANEIYAAGTSHSPWLRPWLLDVQRRAAVSIRFGHDRPQTGASGLEDWTHSSDHAAFHEARIPFVYFGVEDHEDYHRPTDTAERIDARFLGDVADMIVEALRTFDARLPSRRRGADRRRPISRAGVRRSENGGDRTGAA
jgi:Zn-dependent M28 family amino/carboxypeptidase